MARMQDLVGVLRGVQTIVQAGLKVQESNFKIIWDNSSIRALAEECATKIKSDSLKSTPGFQNIINESAERMSTVIVGFKQYATYSNKGTEQENIKKSVEPTPSTFTTSTEIVEEIKLTPSDRELLKKLDREHRRKMAKIATEMSAIKIEDRKEELEIKEHKYEKEHEQKVHSEKPAPKVKTSKNPKSKQSLTATAKQRTVPSSRIGRMYSFGTLAAGLGFGTVAEYARRTVGLGDNTSNLFLTQANMDRIVDTLCKVRGAALKLGQIISIQDESVVSPELAKALERVRKSADFMPDWQVEQVLKTQLGDDWRSKFTEFNIKPFAAASIGQVHSGTIPDGLEVAVKVQYPGVAQGIESDIDNLLSIMKVWKLFPDGMFIDNFAAVAKRELAWEVDYIREAQCTKNFRQLLEPYPEFYVPKVVDNLCTKEIFTTELIDGITIDQCVQLDADERNYIASKIMELCWREIMEFQYMQTDPNWANFFYNRRTKQVLLLDFGATREYPKRFIDTYVKIIKAAIDNDRNTVLHFSRNLGFLTGYESKIMEDAHVTAVMILGEVFQKEDKFDFAAQNTTERLQTLVPTMLTHRLCPPPEEIYSIHRKLSGVFLLCSKLKARINARDIFFNLYNDYKFDS